MSTKSGENNIKAQRKYCEETVICNFLDLTEKFIDGSEKAEQQYSKKEGSKAHSRSLLFLLRLKIFVYRQAERLF